MLISSLLKNSFLTRENLKPYLITERYYGVKYA